MKRRKEKEKEKYSNLEEEEEAEEDDLGAEEGIDEVIAEFMEHYEENAGSSLIWDEVH